MKYYQSSFKDYLNCCHNKDLHPYIKPYDDFIQNTILYGAPGIGKYTQSLKLIEKYSPSQLKYEKKITCITDKHEHTYKMSDIHFEIDMAILGCNAKQLWNEIFIQIIEIVALRNDKRTIIICKNFQNTHNELIDLFYNYIQQSRNNVYGIKISFILLCDTISILPYNVIKSCNQISLSKPNKKDFKHIISNIEKNQISNRVIGKSITKNIQNIFDDDPDIELTNLKELYTLDIANNSQDVFNIISDSLINSILNFNNKSNYIQFREIIYDILTYDINVSECIFYILNFLSSNNYINTNKMTSIILELSSQLKLFNNNYRPIYHLERIFYNIIQHIQ